MTDTKKERLLRQYNILAIRDIAKEIHSPLSQQDIGILIDYDQIATPHPFEDYMILRNVWKVLNSDENGHEKEQIATLVEYNRYSVDMVTELVLKHKKSIKEKMAHT